MITLMKSIINRPASALSMIALCVLLAAVPADARAARSDRNKDDDDKKVTTTAQKTATESRRDHQNSSPSRVENSPRPEPNRGSSFAPNPAPAATRAQSAPAPSYRPDPGNDNRYRPGASVVKPEPARNPAPVVRAEPRSPEPVQTYRPQPKNNDRPTTVGRVEQPNNSPQPVATYRPERKGNDAPAIGRRDEPSRGSRPTKTDPKPVYNTYRQDTKPDPKSVTTRGPEQPRTGESRVTTRKPDASRTAKAPPTPRFDNDRPNTTYRPNPDSNNRQRPDRDDDNRNRPDNNYRPNDRSGNDSNRQWGPAVTYKPSSETRYRQRIGVRYYRPPTVFHEKNVIRTYHVPKSYRPPVHTHGRYYYNNHNRYYNRPLSFGFWAFSFDSGFSCRSIYFHYGYLPYVQVTRVYQTSYPEVVYVGAPIYTRGGYYLENRKYQALDSALADVRGSWISGRYDLIAQHVLPNDKVAVFLDGRYDYSMDGEDYLNMTRDALEDIKTSSFVWDKVRTRDDDTVTAFATHKYYGPSDEIKSVYVSYTLDKIGDRYFVVEVGSSTDPLLYD